MYNKYSTNEHPDDYSGDLYEERQIEKESKKMRLKLEISEELQIRNIIQRQLELIDYEFNKTEEIDWIASHMIDDLEEQLIELKHQLENKKG